MLYIELNQFTVNSRKDLLLGILQYGAFLGRSTYYIKRPPCQHAGNGIDI